MQIVLHEENEEPIYPVVLKHPPYNGDVEVDVRPKTRGLIQRVTEAAKKNPLNRRHTIKDDEGRSRVVDGDFNAAFTMELADAIIVDWRGVVDSSKNPRDCTRENKFKFAQTDPFNYVLQQAGDIAVTEAEEDSKNSEL